MLVRQLIANDAVAENAAEEQVVAALGCTALNLFLLLCILDLGGFLLLLGQQRLSQETVINLIHTEIRTYAHEGSQPVLQTNHSSLSLGIDLRDLLLNGHNGKDDANKREEVEEFGQLYEEQFCFGRAHLILKLN